MPSGAKKRKAAKKKKFNDSNPLNEGNDGGEVSYSTPSVEVVKREEEGNVEIETVSKAKSSSSSSSSDSSDDESRVVEKEVVVVESAPVVESLAEEVSPIVEPVKPVDSLVEEVSQVFDGVKSEENKDLVVEKAPVVEKEPKVDECETAVKDDCTSSTVVVESVLKEDEVERLQPLVEKTSSESKDNVSSSTPPKDLVSDVNGANCANEIDTSEHADRQAPSASTPVAVHNTTSWKSCCGIFELFSGSGRSDHGPLPHINIITYIRNRSSSRAMGLIVIA
ncbi:hypothetical protein M8C21_015830 [Ambrosia artemisiifolia]|uniref:Uncharacterized protein n=1 Tax=Ambrosia artemisiifolia TaxID=4212 RepID=A0AAD5GDQ9_AMBAR|nr:hypothetical protein M8C21_015830 [Ambrosia artemisiifolia]